jgi:hypothetical protein
VGKKDSAIKKAMMNEMIKIGCCCFKLLLPTGVKISHRDFSGKIRNAEKQKNCHSKKECHQRTTKTGMAKKVGGV